MDSSTHPAPSPPMSPKQNRIRAVTWNVRGFGLSNLLRRHFLSLYIHSLSLDFIALQDIIPAQSRLTTPQRNDLAQKLLSKQYPNAIASSYVAFIPLSPRITVSNYRFINDNLFPSEHGRILVVDLVVDSTVPLRVATVYLPPSQSTSCRRRSSALKALRSIEACDQFILLGDVNTYPNPALDSSRCRAPTNPWDAFNESILHLNVHDAFAERNPSASCWSQKNTYGGWSRLDQIMVSAHLLHVTEIRPFKDFIDTAISDHHVVRCSIELPGLTKHGSGRWRLRQAVLQSTEFEQTVTELVNKL